MFVIKEPHYYARRKLNFLRRTVKMFLEKSQKLQLDKQNYGADYIHLYVDDIKSDWLENWTWDDSFESNDWAA